MGEYYQLVCVDKSQTQGHWGKLLEFLFSSRPRVAAQWLLYPLVLPPMPSIPEGKGRVAGAGPNLASLPSELQTAIASHIRVVVDLVCLAATSHALWETCAPHLTTLLHLYLGTSWAGDRVLCLGDYADDQLPAGFFSVEERAKLESPTGSDLYNLASEEYREVGGGTGFAFSKEKREAIARRPGAHRWPPVIAFLKDKRGLADAPLAALCAARPTHLRAPAVLRNLSKKRYVRARALDAFNADAGNVRRYGKQVLALGTAMTAAVLFSGDVRGSWVGARLDIVSERRFEEETNGGEGWKDHSEAFVEMLTQQLDDFCASSSV